MPTIQTPRGPITVPDDASPEEIQELVGESGGAPPAAPPGGGVVEQPTEPTEQQRVSQAETPGFKGPTSATEAFGAGATDVATMGWGDEIMGGLAGDQSEAKDFERRSSRSFQEHPYAYVAGGAAGLVPGLVAAPFATAARGVQAAIGGVSGALQGLGEGDTPLERGKNAAVGGGLGAAAGFLSPQIAAIAKRAAEVLGFGAANKVARALQDGEITVEAAQKFIDDAAQRGQPARLGDVPTPSGGASPAGREARAAANIDAGAQNTLGAEFAVRSDPDERLNRFRTFLNRPEIGGGRPTREAREALITRARAENQPAYNRAFAHPNAASVWTPELAEAVSTSPSVQRAIRDVAEKSGDRAVAQGGAAIKNPFKINADGTVTLPEGVTPTLEFWDHVQRNLRQQAQSLPEAGLGKGPGDAARDVIGVRQRLNGILDKAVPDFQRARQGAAGFFGEESALDVGKMLAQGGLRDPEKYQDAAAAVAKMTPAERALMRDGYLDTIQQRVGSSDIGNPANKAVGSPNDRAAARLVLGDDAGQQVIDFANTERAMDLFQKAATGNSTSAQQAHDIIAKYAPGGAMAAGGAQALITGGANADTALAAGAKGAAAYAVATAAALANAGLQKAQARRVAEAFVSDDPKVRARVYSMMRASPNIRAAVSQFVGRFGAEAADRVNLEDQPQ